MSERKWIEAAVVDLKDTGPGGWTAVASTAEVDRDGESVAYGCFEPLPASIPVHSDHTFSIETLVGRARPYYSGQKLMVEGTFAVTPKAQLIRDLVRQQVVSSMSIVMHNAVRKQVHGVTTITKAELIACDFVSLPANRNAMVVSARSLDNDMAFMAVKAALLRLQIDLDDMVQAEAKQALVEAKSLLHALERR